VNTRPARLVRQLRDGCRHGYQHARLRPLLDAYLDGELSRSDRARVAAHLAACFACSGSVETLRLIKQSLRSRPRRTPADLAEARLRRFGDALIHTDPAPQPEETW
jgi:anti-sigma factor RsiW